VRAHAKINLDLRVLGTRADGFHELRTVFQAIALHDTVSCAAREGPLAIECDAAGVPLDESNLVWRAAQAFWRALRRPGQVRDVSIRLEKRIPIEAGLGGGSADAAATLVALARLWRVPVRPAQLIDIGATLGADVPFFLSGGTALGLGRGEEIYPLADLPRHWVVLLIPGFGVSTSEAYAWYDAERELGRGAPVREAQHVPGPWPSRAAQMINDLEARLRGITGDRSDEGGVAPVGRGGRRHVGQRVRRVRAVSEAQRGGARDRSPAPLVARHPHRIAGPRRVRAPQPSAARRKEWW
jgi:4-diphosphocytidyl-2C-methyl-D-erythritol kinase